MSRITVHMEPNVTPVSFEEFCSRSPRFSVALDGYVAAGPRFDPDGPRVNFNHHEDVSRLETRATCAQVLISVRQGFFECFRDDGGKRAEIFVNDCDEDVCTSIFLLKHSHLIEPAMNPRINRLVMMEDLLDATAGAYPFPPNLPSLAELAWVFEPYRRCRLSGELDRKEPHAYTGVLVEVEHRILQHIGGSGDTIALDTRYERIGGGKRWTMVREVGSHARTGMFADGIRAYVSVRPRTAGRYTYTLGRMSPFIPFPIPKLLELLNEVEKTGEDRWGGGDTIGGSPRVAGSGLSPEELSRVIEDVLAP